MTPWEKTEVNENRGKINNFFAVGKMGNELHKLAVMGYLCIHSVFLVG